MFQIADKFGVNRSVIETAMEHYGIKRRTAGEASRLAFAQGRVDFSNMAKGERSGNWKGGRTKRHGYIYVLRPEHPRANASGYVGEHIVVWEEAHAEPLPKGWVVHHLNGIKDDNRPVNLVGLPSKKHSGVLKAKAERVRQLEDEVDKLKYALNSNQMIFGVS